MRILTRTSVSQLHHKVLLLFKGCRRYSASQGCQSVTDAVCGRPGGSWVTRRCLRGWGWRAQRSGGCGGFQVRGEQSRVASGSLTPPLWTRTEEQQSQIRIIDCVLKRRSKNTGNDARSRSVFTIPGEKCLWSPSRRYNPVFLWDAANRGLNQLFSEDQNNTWTFIVLPLLRFALPDCPPQGGTVCKQMCGQRWT